MSAGICCIVFLRHQFVLVSAEGLNRLPTVLYVSVSDSVAACKESVKRFEGSCEELGKSSMGRQRVPFVLRE